MSDISVGGRDVRHHFGVNVCVIKGKFLVLSLKWHLTIS